MDTRGAAREVGRVSKAKDEMPQPPKYDSVLKVRARGNLHILPLSLPVSLRPSVRPSL